jgi:hypothetical protein
MDGTEGMDAEDGDEGEESPAVMSDDGIRR